MNSKENRKRQLHIFVVQRASNMFVLASVCSNPATGVQVKLDKMKQKKMYVRKTNKYQDQRKIKTVKEFF